MMGGGRAATRKRAQWPNKLVPVAPVMEPRHPVPVVVAIAAARVLQLEAGDADGDVETGLTFEAQRLQRK